MSLNKKMKLLLLATPIVLSGCAELKPIVSDMFYYKSENKLDYYSNTNAGFNSVAAKTKTATNKESVWIQSQDEANRVAKRVHALVYKKTISADTAVQVALLNNKGLQAAYADIGMSSAEVWQQTLPENPKMSVGLLDIAAPGLGVASMFESVIAANILALMTKDRRVGLADAKFKKAQLAAVNETLSLAVETRRAWIEAVAAFETLNQINQIKELADVSSELSGELANTGAMPKTEQARQHLVYAELTAQTAESKLAAKLAKENLTRLLGIWGSDVDYFVPNNLPSLPNTLKTKNRIEGEALRNRVDLQLAKQQLEITAKAYGLTNATRYVTDFEIIGGGELEREREDGEPGVKSSFAPQLEFEFIIPIFDSGKARLRKAELAYMRDANLLAEKAINIRSEARAAYINYRSTHDIARHYQNNVIRLQSAIVDESLLTYNGMITNTFELLADRKAKTGGQIQVTKAKREFWLANANLSAAIFGGGASAGGGGGGDVAIAGAEGGGH